ncbi:PerC family transcriptional regulator [Escherichia fergusonii]|nr:PerC family transcriptional regulator [Escherichia fergusonii]
MSDSKAEALEARGLYRRAADRWLDVMMLSTDADDRRQARQCRERCLRNAQRPQVTYRGREAATKVQKDMGIDMPYGRAFRVYRKPARFRPQVITSGGK